MAERELGRFKRTNKQGDTEQFVVSTGKFAKNNEHVDFRSHYISGDGTFRPTKQGVRTDIENIPKVIRLLGEGVSDTFSEELNALMDKHNL